MAASSKHLTSDELGWLLVAAIVVFLGLVIFFAIPHASLPSFFLQLLVVLAVCGGALVFALRKYGDR